MMIDVLLVGGVGIMGWRDATLWNKCPVNQPSDDRRVHQMRTVINKGIHEKGFHPSNILTEEIYDD